MLGKEGPTTLIYTFMDRLRVKEQTCSFWFWFCEEEQPRNLQMFTNMWPLPSEQCLSTSTSEQHNNLANPWNYHQRCARCFEKKEKRGKRHWWQGLQSLEGCFKTHECFLLIKMEDLLLGHKRYHWHWDFPSIHSGRCSLPSMSLALEVLLETWLADRSYSAPSWTAAEQQKVHLGNWMGDSMEMALSNKNVKSLWAAKPA